MKQIFKVELSGLQTTGRGWRKTQKLVSHDVTVLTTGGVNGAMAAAQRKFPNVYVDRINAVPVMAVDVLALRG